MCRRIFRRGRRGRNFWRLGLRTARVGTSERERELASARASEEGIADADGLSSVCYDLDKPTCFLFHSIRHLACSLHSPLADANKFLEAFEAAKKHNAETQGGTLAESQPVDEESSSDSDSGSDSEDEKKEETKEETKEEVKEEAAEEKKDE